MTDYIASYLLNGNFLLTALEFYQELLESGQEQKLLKDFFENRKYTQTQLHEHSQTGDQLRLTNDDDGKNASTINPQEVLVLSNELKKKDATISMLEYEVRVLNSDVEKMKAQLRDVFVPLNKRHNIKEKSENNLRNDSMHVSHNKTENNVTANDSSGVNAIVDDPEHTLQNLNKQPLTQHEKQVINYLIKDYLMENNYQVTGISFTDEVNTNDMVNLDDLNLDVQVSNVLNSDEHDFGNSTNTDSSTLSLLYLYRYYYKLNPQQLQNLLNSRKDQKDKRALRKALETIDEKSKQLEELERHLLEQEKEAEMLRTKNAELEEQIRLLRVEKETSLSTAAPVEIPVLSLNAAPSPRKFDISTTSSTGSPMKSTVIPNTPTGGSRQLESDKRESAVLKILGERLPVLIRAAKSDKRDEFMPLIISILQYHPDQKVRDKISACLFTLAKKPDEAQRESIMNGCIMLARRISPERFENELLPQCWEHAMSKVPERRILVADVCGQLAPYVKPTLRPSLFLSMIRQLASDKVDQVRESVAVNLGRLIKTFGSEDDEEGDISDSKNKYSIVEEMTMALLMDRVEAVVKVTQEHLIPIMAKWAASFGLLFSNLLPTLFDHIEALIKKASPKMANDEALTSQKIVHLIMVIRSLVPEVYNRVLATMPNDILYKTSNKDTVEDRKHAFEEYIRTGDFAIHSDAQIPKDWTGLYWLSTVGIIRFLSIIVSIEQNKAASNELYATTAQLCTTFGNDFVVGFLNERFMGLLESDDAYQIRNLIHEAADAELSKHPPTYIVKERLLPVYFSGLLSSLISQREPILEFVRDRIRALLVAVAKERGSWSQSHVVLVGHALDEACRANKQLLEVILKLLHDDLMTDSSKSVRLLVAVLMNGLITVVDTGTLMQHIMPCIATLSSDVDVAVQLAALRALGTMTLNVDREVDFDRLAAQYEHFFLQRTTNPEAFREALRIMARIIPKVEAYFRDQFALRKLVQIGRDNNVNEKLEDRKTVTLLLFDCYRALNGCLLTRDAIQTYILVGLEMLDADCEVLNDNSVRNSVRGMLKDLKNAVKPKSVQTPSSSSSTPSSSGPSTGDPSFSTSGAKLDDGFSTAQQNLKKFFSFARDKK